MSENIYLSFRFWFIFLNVMNSSSIHFSANDIISFLLWLNNTLLCLCHIFFIPSSANGHLGCFRELCMVNSAAINMSM
jgi:hypothetical protein